MKMHQLLHNDMCSLSLVGMIAMPSVAWGSLACHVLVEYSSLLLSRWLQSEKH